MSSDAAPAGPEALRQETREIWNAIAPTWDAYMGEGRGFRNLLIGPATERLLALQPDELVLDIGCGNGVCARRMAQFGARVVAKEGVGNRQ